MDEENADINPRIADAVGLASLAPTAVAGNLAEIADLRPPTRPESVEFLVATLQLAASEIPIEPAAWSWGEFHHMGIYPAHEIVQSDDPVRLAICAADLGLADRAWPDSVDTPRRALAGNLVAAAELLLRRIHERLEAAGISPYGHQGLE